MSANLSATIHFEPDGQGGTIPVVEYVKASSYETKQNGSQPWQYNNTYSIKGTVTDVNLSASKISTITDSDGKTWHVWAQEDTPITDNNVQYSNVSLYIGTFVSGSPDMVLGDVLDTFLTNSYATLDKNQVAINIGNGTTLTTPIGDLNAGDVSGAIRKTLVTPSYYQPGMLTRVLGYEFDTPHYDPSNPLAGNVGIHWDWTNNNDIAIATIGISSIAVATAGVGLAIIEIIQSGGISAYFFGVAGTTTTATVTLAQQNDSMLTVIPQTFLQASNIIDQLPNVLSSSQVQSFTVSLPRLAATFNNSIAIQNQSLYQTFALKAQENATIFNFILQKTNGSGNVLYTNNLSPAMMQLFLDYYKYSQYANQFLFQVNNSGQPTIH